jgi:hypothetical protein
MAPFYGAYQDNLCDYTAALGSVSPGWYRETFLNSYPFNIIRLYSGDSSWYMDLLLKTNKEEIQ